MMLEFNKALTINFNILYGAIKVFEPLFFSIFVKIRKL